MVAAIDNMRIAKKVMNQKAVYWSSAALDIFGKSTWDDPVEIDCRWEDIQEEYINPNGEKAFSNAHLLVDRDLKIKGMLWLGKLVDVTDEDNPKNNDNVWEILQIKKTPDFKGQKYLREVYL